jgi:hypothetical protein
LDSSIARIELTLNAIERRPSGTIVGPIWIASDTLGAAFPEVGWSDFPVALLGAWLPAFRRLVARGQAAECYFMDGPYHFTVTAALGDDWRVACFEHREGPTASNAVAEWKTSPREFIDSAIAAGRRILGHCDARGWWDDDTDRLRTALTGWDLDAAS